MKYRYIIIHKFKVGKIVVVFEGSLFCSINGSKNTVKQNIVKYYLNSSFLFEYILKCFFSVIKAEFSASLLQSSVSHDPSEIILIYWFTTIFISFEIFQKYEYMIL